MSMPTPVVTPEVQARQTALLYRIAALGHAVTVSVSALLAYIGYISRPGSIIIVWWLLMLGLSIARYQLARRYAAVQPAPTESKAWNARYINATAWISLLWLIGGGLIMWGNTDPYRFLTGLVLAAMVAGAVPVLSPVKAAFRVFAIPILGGVAMLTFAGAAAPVDWVFGVMILVFLGAMLRSADFLHDTLTESMAFVLEKGSLVENLERAKEAAETANKELQKMLVELDRIASTDKLTGAWTRRRLEEAVVNEMDRLKRYDHPLSQLIIYVDFFKKINDCYGHTVGDQVLAELAAIVQSSLRVADSLTRWGGEEFVVLCPSTTLATVRMMAERLRERIARSVFPTVENITVSIGVAEYMAAETWEQWFQRADVALYRAKTSGRNQVQVAPEMPQRLGVGDDVSANLVQFIWRPANECGHPIVDSQHRALFVDANNLLAAVLSGRPTDEVAAQIDILIRDIVQHFKDEEAIITAAGFPGAAAHAAIHSAIVDKAVSLVGRFHAGTLGIGELFQFLAHDVVARHLLGADREFFPYLGDKR